MADQIEAQEIFKAGDHAMGTITAENNDPGQVAVHVDTGEPEPAISVYLSPASAARLGERLIRAAEDAVPPEAFDG